MIAESMSPGWTGLVCGLFALAVGLYSWFGRGLRLPASSPRGRPAVPLFAGLSFILAGMQWLLRAAGADDLATVLALLAGVAMLLSLWSYFVRAPRWATPRWQRTKAD